MCKKTMEVRENLHCYFQACDISGSASPIIVNVIERADTKIKEPV